MNDEDSVAIIQIDRTQMTELGQIHITNIGKTGGNGCGTSRGQTEPNPGWKEQSLTAHPIIVGLLD